MKLFRDLTEEAQNPINELGFQSFQAPESMEEFQQFLIDNFGAMGTQEEAKIKSFLNDYFNYKIGFTEIVRAVYRDNYLDAYIDLTSIRQSKFTTIPILGSQKVNEEVDNKFIIDFSSILLFYFLEKKMDFKFEEKFIISSFIRDIIESELIELKTSPQSVMSMNITMKGIKKYEVPEDYTESRINFINALLSWVDSNCETVIVEEKLDVILKLKKNNKGFDSNFMNIIIDNIYLSKRENHYLISSDSSLFTLFRNNTVYYNIISPEVFLRTFYPEKCNIDFYKFLLKSNYLGIDIDLDTLKNEFYNFISGQENYYLLTLENLQFSIHNNPDKIDVYIEFLKHIYLMNSLTLENKNRYAQEFIRNSILGMPIPLVKNYFSMIKIEFTLLGGYYDAVLNEFKTVLEIFRINKDL